jgi:hypothetical protein
VQLDCVVNVSFLQVGEEVVRCPGEVVLTCYAPCRDIRNTLTPDLKHPGK